MSVTLWVLLPILETSVASAGKAAGRGAPALDVDTMGLGAAVTRHPAPVHRTLILVCTAHLDAREICHNYRDGPGPEKP